MDQSTEKSYYIKVLHIKDTDSNKHSVDSSNYLFMMGDWGL